MTHDPAPETVAPAEDPRRDRAGGVFVRLWRALRRIVRENRTEAVMVAVALVVLAVATIPSPYAIERPGPVVDVLGTVPVEGEDVPVLTVEDQPDTAADGQLNLLTVSIAGSPQRPLSWIALVPALFDPSQEIAQVSQFYPEGITVEQREEVTSLQMDASQVVSATAAFRAMGLHVGVSLSVGDVDTAGPAAGVLQPGDELVSVNGKKLTSFEQLIETVSASTDPLTFELVRDGQTRTEQVAPRVPTDGEEPRLGIAVSTSYELPRTVDISVPQIGGPSAGLIFGLAIMDRMGEGPDLGGLTVSGTGTLNEDGAVGPIGGLTQKAWAASRADTDLFLMPIANCPDVQSFPKDLKVAPVATLEDAVAAINAASAGETVPGLEACTSANVG